jgi:hypothetical protein
MGLDMSLEGRQYISEYTDKELKEKIEEVLVSKLPIKVSGVTFELGYWRKANAIHNWFIENCANGLDDCNEAYVSKEQLLELKETCEKALEATSEEEKEELLPTQSGFFFGSTEYDEYYDKCLRDTIEIVNNTIKLLETNDMNIYYSSSW